MAIHFLKKPKDTLRRHSERSEYRICLRCETVNKIDIGQGYGIRYEFHERGVCLLKHPTWLWGSYNTYLSAEQALQVILGRLAKKRSKKVRRTASPNMIDRRSGRLEISTKVRSAERAYAPPSSVMDNSAYITEVPCPARMER